MLVMEQVMLLQLVCLVLRWIRWQLIQFLIFSSGQLSILRCLMPASLWRDSTGFLSMLNRSHWSGGRVKMQSLVVVQEVLMPCLTAKLAFLFLLRVSLMVPRLLIYSWLITSDFIIALGLDKLNLLNCSRTFLNFNTRSSQYYKERVLRS